MGQRDVGGDLYRIEPGGLTGTQYRDAIRASEIAAVILLGQYTDPAGADDGGYDGGGWSAPESTGRAEIHQATGMVLARLGVGAADALARLRAHASAEQRLLIEVARDVAPADCASPGTWTDLCPTTCVCVDERGECVDEPVPR